MYILDTNVLHRNNTRLEQAPDYKYRYPNPPGPLKPGTEKHDKLRDEIMVRAFYARNQLSPKFDIWRETDKKLTMYIDMSEQEKLLKLKDPNRPSPIVVPVTYAALETLMAYMCTVFLDDPIIRYSGTDGSDILGAMLMELVVNKQIDRLRGALAIYSMLRNSFAYGVGLLSPMWTSMLTMETMRAKQGFFDKVFSRHPAEYTKRTVQFEGNRLELIDPYNWLPDPNHAVQNIQRSEFQGWIARESLSQILIREKEQSSSFINGLYVKHIDGRSALSLDESGREDRSGISAGIDNDVVKPVDTIYMYIQIIPEDWGLGNRRYPELWQFGLSGDSVITLAEPVQYNHGMIPMAVAAPDFDGFSPAPMAKLETVYGLQVFADFLENSHITARRKSINGSIVYDPFMINGKDLESVIPGDRIRTRRQAWGKGVKDAIDVLNFGDPTLSHVEEIGALSSMMHMAVGSESVIRGVPITGRDRVTAEEYSGTRSSALQRLEKDARLVALMAMWDLSFMMAKNTQQFMSQDVMVRIAGRHIEELQQTFGEAALVDPAALSVDFDIDIHSYGVPAGGSPDVWINLLKLVSENQVVAQGVDVLRLFQHTARVAGAKGISNFMKPTPNMQLMNDETALAQAQAGNIVPMNEVA